MSYFLLQSGSSETPDTFLRAAPVTDDADDFEESDEGGTQENEEEVATGNGGSGYPVPGSGSEK